MYDRAADISTNFNQTSFNEQYFSVGRKYTKHTIAQNGQTDLAILLVYVALFGVRLDVTAMLQYTL